VNKLYKLQKIDFLMMKMVSKEDKAFLVGTATVVITAFVLNLVLKYDFTVSVIIGAIIGVVAGLSFKKFRGE
jgi:putative flippase GtrA